MPKRKIKPDALPTAITSVITAMAPGWDHGINRARAAVPRTRLGAPRGDGTRPRETYLEYGVRTFLLVAQHPATGRGLIALWVAKRGGTGYALETCARGRHPGEHSPRELSATELKAYVAEDLAPAAELELEDEDAPAVAA